MGADGTEAIRLRSDPGGLLAVSVPFLLGLLFAEFFYGFVMSVFFYGIASYKALLFLSDIPTAGKRRNDTRAKVIS